MKSRVIALCVLSLIVALGACSKRGPRSSEGGYNLSSVLKPVYFELDQATIGGDQVSTLEANASYIKSKTNLSVMVQGHCDERGTNEYNLALGDRRARATKNYLVNLGVNPSRLSVISYGEEKPVCTESDESCWWKNRRADFGQK